MNIYTIGHSVHSKQRFLDMLNHANIEVLADVRAFPQSQKFSQFNQQDFKKWLTAEGIKYEYFPLLSRRRNKPQYVQEELNDEWINPSFHHYADYTLTPDFEKGIKRLKDLANKKKTAICCSERHPARCHRLLISNSLAAEGWDVYHIFEQRTNIFLERHELGKWGALPILERDGTVIYPKPD